MANNPTGSEIKKTPMAPSPIESANGTEESRARDLARRYRCDFVDLKNFHIQHDLFRSVPVDLMFRYDFVPLENSQDGRLIVAIADPSRLMMLDELSPLLAKRIVTKVATISQIKDILKKTDLSQRVLQEAGEGFVQVVIRADDSSDETIS